MARRGSVGVPRTNRLLAGINRLFIGVAPRLGSTVAEVLLRNEDVENLLDNCDSVAFHWKAHPAMTRWAPRSSRRRIGARAPRPLPRRPG